jgi:hypothetical protein
LRIREEDEWPESVVELSNKFNFPFVKLNTVQFQFLFSLCVLEILENCCGFFLAANSKRWLGREVAAESEMVAGERDCRKGER